MSAPRYYQPRPIVTVPGLVHKPGRGYRYWHDDYIGTAEMIVAAGLATIDHLPGRPGNPIARTTLRPLGVEPANRIDRTPGHMVIFRTLGGKFRVVRTVSYEEQERRERKAAIKAEENEAAMDESERRESAWRSNVETPANVLAAEAEALRLALQAIAKARGA